MRLKNTKNTNNGNNMNNINNGINEADERRCVIVVGSTGTGKSSTISKTTGIPVKQKLEQINPPPPKKICELVWN